MSGPERAALDEMLAAAVALAGDDELVTEALSRDLELPRGAGTMALVTLDNGEDHTTPNSFGARGLASLNTAIDAALDRDEVRAIGITGKPFILAAGADLDEMGRVTNR